MLNSATDDVLYAIGEASLRAVFFSSVDIRKKLIDASFHCVKSTVNRVDSQSFPQKFQRLESERGKV